MSIIHAHKRSPLLARAFIFTIVGTRIRAVGGAVRTVRARTVRARVGATLNLNLNTTDRPVEGKGTVIF